MGQLTTYVASWDDPARRESTVTMDARVDDNFLGGIGIG